MIDFPTNLYDQIIWCYNAWLAFCSGVGLGTCIMAPISIVSLSIEFACKKRLK
jgi:hypothetical protein